MKRAYAKWLQYAGIGAGISLAGGLVLHVPLLQIVVSMALTAGLVFSGFAMQSAGRPEKAVQQQ
ncbi:hypothetical protein [Candidatus Nitrososphaera evergladensis]|uniref:hypothetical protein n=1 Tax=Candidatus Nitrososphaera evergladensis TaxID=1459637 RepID=UPI0011E5D2E3|nr:hypothetical protein [Candidatus Nitrososphaera evergladensis]